MWSFPGDKQGTVGALYGFTCMWSEWVPAEGQERMVWNDLRVRGSSETGSVGPGAAAVSAVPRGGQTSPPGDLRSSLGTDRGVLVPGPLVPD